MATIICSLITVIHGLSIFIASPIYPLMMGIDIDNDDKDNDRVIRVAKKLWIYQATILLLNIILSLAFYSEISQKQMTMNIGIIVIATYSLWLVREIFSRKKN